MSFRWNFLLDCVSSTSWVFMNLGFYLLIFRYANEIGAGTGWGKYEFFVFLSTTMFVNSIVQALFMPSAEELSELIRTGSLDFALLKPIDTQFLVSFHRVEWSSLSNFLVGLGLLVYSLLQLTTRSVSPLTLHPIVFLLYPFYVICGVLILYCSDGQPRRHQHLVGPEPIAVQLLVLYHELLTVSDGDLRGGDHRHAAADGFSPSSFPC